MPFIFRDLLAIVLAFAFSFLAPITVLAAEATGEWLIEDGDARVRIAPCGADLCGSVASIKEGAPTVDVNNPDPAKRSRPLLGSAVLLGLKPTAAGEWTGSLYDAENGRTYIGKLTIIDEHHLKVAGCVLGGLICESQIWTRTK